jgi:hypothetical protein
VQARVPSSLRWLRLQQTTADDSVALHASRDSGSESETDDERLERRMRAVLNPTVLDRNFSDDELGRRLRSSCRKGRNDEPDEPPTMEVVEELGPSSITSRETGTEAAGDLPPLVPEPVEDKRPPTSNANVFEKVEINFIKPRIWQTYTVPILSWTYCPTLAVAIRYRPTPAVAIPCLDILKMIQELTKLLRPFAGALCSTMFWVWGGGEGQQISLHLWVPFLRGKIVRNWLIVT